MSTQTTNYGFLKPALTDSPPDFTAPNSNWDTVDEELKNHADAIASFAEADLVAFTSNNTWVIPDGVEKVKIYACASGSGVYAGGYVIGTEYSVTPGSNLAITVGSGNTVISGGGLASTITLVAGSVKKSLNNNILGFVTGVAGVGVGGRLGANSISIGQGVGYAGGCGGAFGFGGGAGGYFLNSTSFYFYNGTGGTGGCGGAGGILTSTSVSGTAGENGITIDVSNLSKFTQRVIDLLPNLAKTAGGGGSCGYSASNMRPSGAGGTGVVSGGTGGVCPYTGAVYIAGGGGGAGGYGAGGGGTPETVYGQSAGNPTGGMVLIVYNY